MSLLTITKPKKGSKGTYVCPVESQTRVHIPCANLLDIRGSGNEYVVTLKCGRDVLNTISDIGESVLEYVKKYRVEWFKRTLSDELIDDYFTQCIAYHKRHGQILKLQCLNDLSELESGCVSLLIELKDVRFYKQKFVLEWEIVECGEQNSELINIDDEEEEPMPLDEDIAQMKEDYLQALRDKIGFYQSYIEKLSNATEYKEVSSICDDLHKILA